MEQGATRQLPRSEAIMEVLPLSLRDGTIHLVLLADLAIQVGWHAEVHPSDVAGEVVTEFGLTPIVAHSTSWRHEPRKLIVTYAAVVDVPAPPAPMLKMRPVQRVELARGGALHAPRVIGVEHVAEHALRHLWWLVNDDEAIRAAMPEAWREVLAAYPPEPFRSFEGDWGER